MVAFPISTAALRSGVSTHLIRMWERRYAAISPERSDGNRRLYTDAEVARLRLLHQATSVGYRISQVAKLDDGQLRELVAAAEELPVENARLRSAEEVESESAELIARALAAVDSADQRGLSTQLSLASSRFGPLDFLSRIVEPLMIAIGERWHDGSLRIYHEHLASIVVRSNLTNLLASMPASEEAPVAIAATPRDQLHELGALSAAIAAAASGWRTMYAGPSLPSQELAQLAATADARALLLSASISLGSQDAGPEILRVAELAPPRLTVVVGGEAAPSLFTAHQPPRNVRRVAGIGDLVSLLEQLSNGSDHA